MSDQPAGVSDAIARDREIPAEVRAARLAKALSPEPGASDAENVGDDEAERHQAAKNAADAANAAELGRALRREVRAADHQDSLRAAINDTEDPGPEAVTDPALRRAFRESFGISRRELGAVLGVPVEAVARFEDVDGGASNPFDGPGYRRALAVFAQNAAEKGER